MNKRRGMRKDGKKKINGAETQKEEKKDWANGPCGIA